MGLLKKAEAAALLGVSMRTLEGLIKRGALPAYKIGPKLVRLRTEDIEIYLSGHRAAPAAEKPAARPCGYVPGMRVI